MFYELNTKPESINIFSHGASIQQVSLNRSHSAIHFCLLSIHIVRVFKAKSRAHIANVCVYVYFASIFTIYNYISSRFAYDALKPFIYYRRPEKNNTHTDYRCCQGIRRGKMTQRFIYNCKIECK